MWSSRREHAVAWLSALSCLAPALSSAQSRPAPLQGLNAVTVVTTVEAPAGALPAGLTESRLQTLAELKLRGWALRVITADEAANTPGVTPRVELDVTLLETRA